MLEISESLGDDELKKHQGGLEESRGLTFILVLLTMKTQYSSLAAAFRALLLHSPMSNILC